MGNDGGTIMGRMFVTVKKPKKQAREVSCGQSTKALWSLCRLSQKELEPPLALDRLGQLFNKEEVVTLLLEKRRHPDFPHLTCLRDIFDVKVTLATPALGQLRFIQCPLSSILANGTSRFEAVLPCGHVFASKALDELRPAICPSCDTELAERKSWVELNPSDEKARQLAQELAVKGASEVNTRAGLARLKRDSRKQKKAKELSVAAAKLLDLDFFSKGDEVKINGYNRLTR